MAEFQPLSMEAGHRNDVEPLIILSARDTASLLATGGAMELGRAAYLLARTRSQGVSAPSFGQVNRLSSLLP